MFDYIRFDAQVIEDGVAYATPDETFTKVADGGTKNNFRNGLFLYGLSC